MTPIYLSSMGIIGLMFFAAVHNRRSGWRKERNSAVRDLHEMSAVWRGLQNAGEGSPLATPVAELLTPESTAGFSGQLVNLQTALHQEGRVVAREQPVGVAAR